MVLAVEADFLAAGVSRTASSLARLTLMKRSRELAGGEKSHGVGRNKWLSAALEWVSMAFQWLFFERRSFVFINLGG